MRRPSLPVLTAWSLLLLACAAAPAADVKTVVVNEYFGVTYKSEPVSFDVDLDRPARAADIGLKEAPSQMEILAGTPEAVTKARVWTLVDFDAPGQKLFTVVTAGKAADGASPFTIDAAGGLGGDGGPGVGTISNGRIHARVPVRGSSWAGPVSAVGVAGPVVSLSANGKDWYGTGYLDTMLRLEKVTVQENKGPVYLQYLIHYQFEEGREYRVDLRLFAGKPYVKLAEDFNLGGAGKFIFNYDDWKTPHFITCGDQAQTKLRRFGEMDANDFIREEGQTCFVRLVVWTQFGYFQGKSETIGLCDANGLGVGAFYLRPDRWTRAKVNHVDLYQRPEVPGDRMTRGVVGLQGSKERLAMEAWLVDGHREWALFAMPMGQWLEPPTPPTPENPKGTEGKFEWEFLGRKAHVVEGVWPLDRINRLPLVWNADGSPVPPEASRPTVAVGGTPSQVLKAMQGRSGLQCFNGSEGRLRGTAPPATGWDGAVSPTKPSGGGPLTEAQAAQLQPGQTVSGKGLSQPAQVVKVDAAARKVTVRVGRGSQDIAFADLLVPGNISQLVETAMTAYMAEDESAYPSIRSMLPWTDPEALNPFYQGMENMNFNADRYRYVLTYGLRLAALGHPEAQRFVLHGQDSFHMALDRYVYPQSGCWEESHGYAGHTIKTVAPMVMALKNSKPPAGAYRNFIDDLRFARMMEFFLYVHSPVDAEFGNRVVPPVGDHGLSKGGPASRFKDMLNVFSGATDPKVRKIVRNVAWMVQEDGGTLPAGIEPEKPDLSSRWLQGYGTVLRAGAPGADAAKPAESFVVLRAGQSWGHHHQDKGSLWGWFRNVHFFGDASWGGPPGGTYWNEYKQGPPGHTQIEFVGVNNWTLPCKYPAPWISDDQYAPDQGYDYANARCLFPFNPRLALDQAGHPVATRNGYDRQVLFVHPELLIVRDNVETNCKTIWRLHSYQPAGTTARKGGATLESPQGVVGQLTMAWPKDVEFQVIDGHDLNGSNEPFKSSRLLKWDMPTNTSATWVFGVHAKDQAAPKVETLDDAGKVARVTLPDGTEVTALLNIEPFTFSGAGIEFEGTVGLVIKKAGKTTAHPIRAGKLTAR